MSFLAVSQFEKELANFFGSPHAIAVDSCTHGMELALRYTKATEINVPTRTYISVPFLAPKLNISLNWNKKIWKDYYYITPNIIDAAVLWKRNSYIPGTFMAVSFQFQKHLSLGRGGVILTDNLKATTALKKMSYDGRSPDIPWREQDIDTIGYHYYMTPETAQLGLEKLPAAITIPPRQWQIKDWPDLTQLKIFK